MIADHTFLSLPLSKSAMDSFPFPDAPWDDQCAICGADGPCAIMGVWVPASDGPIGQHGVTYCLCKACAVANREQVTARIERKVFQPFN